MRLRLRTAAALIVCSVLTPAVAHAQDLGGPNDPPAGGERTREGAIATAQHGNFSDRSLGGGGSSGGRRTYTCEWFDWGQAQDGGAQSDLEGDAGDDPLTVEDLASDFEAYGFDAEAGDYLLAYIRCFEGGTQADWSPRPQQWTPGSEMDIDPADLAQDAWNMIDYPIPVGEAAPPLDVGTYAQLPTGFGVDDWDTLTATATAGPPDDPAAVTSTVTANPVQQEWIVHDSLRGDYSFSCEQQGTASPDSPCAWEPEHSSAGQTLVHPDTGEPCFDVTILVQWEVMWEWTAPEPYESGTESLGSDWMASSTCLVVAEIQAVVDSA